MTSTPLLAPAPAGRALPRPWSSWLRPVAVASITATSTAIVLIWISGGGITALLGGGAEAVTTLGRVTGLVASNLLLYQVLLMARVPLLEGAFGHDGLTRAHRLTGFWSFWLMLAHIVLITAGYSLAASANPIGQLWDLIWNYPAMLLATAGTLLLIAVVALSIRAARRRLRYESWHLLHLYAYLGVFLALPHQLWTGADFLVSPLATAYWWSLWALAAGCVVAFRIVRPILRSRRHRLRVAAVRRDGDASVTVEVDGRELDRLGTRPGQFFVWRLLDGPGWMRGHPYSISAAPGRDSLRFTAKIVGDGTRRLAEARPGTPVLIEGPYGGLGDRIQGRRMLLIGAGAGVAPLVSVLDGAGDPLDHATLVTRDSSPAERVLAQEIDELVTRRGLLHYALDGPRATSGSTWIPQTYRAWQGAQLVSHLVRDPDDLDVLVCGPGEWMDAVVADALVAGVPRGRIHTEHFSI